MASIKFFKKTACALVALTCLVIMLAPINARAGLLGFKIEGALGIVGPKLEGTTAFLGDTLNLGNDMSLDSRQVEIRGWISFEHPLPFLPDLKLEYSPLTANGETTISGGLTWGDLEIADGLQGQMDAKINMLDATFYWHIPLLRTLSANILDVQWGLTVRYIDAKIQVTESLSGRTSTGKGSVPVPLLYLGARVEPLKWLVGMVELRGIAYNSNKIFDVKAAVRFFPFNQYLFFGVGYTYTRFDLPDLGDINLDVKISGPFVEVGFSF